MFTSTFFIHNENLSAKLEKRVPRPILAYSNNINECNECFGLVDPKEASQVDTSEIEVDGGTPKVKIDTLSFDDVKQQLKLLQGKVEMSEHDDAFQLTDAYGILQQAVSHYYITKKLLGMTSTFHLQAKDLIFSSILASIEGYQAPQSSPEDEAQRRLENVLCAWKFRQVQVAGDGNCLFAAVALAVIQSIHNGDLRPIQRLGLDRNANMTTIMMALRRLMVHEWSTNDYYQAFVTFNITTVSDEFLESGCFQGDLGDLMVLTLANILHCPIVLFTSIANMPVICITPTVETIDTTCPIYLTFIQSGAGHYDYAIQSDEDDHKQRKEKSRNTRCTCGRKCGYKGMACSTNRCICVHSKRSCTSLCCCKHCANVHGVRPPPAVGRKRIAYDTQKQPLCGRTTDSFLAEKGERKMHGPLTLLEILTLKAIIIYLMLNGLDVTVDCVASMYEMVLKLVSLDNLINFPLTPLDKKSISSFMKRLHVELELLKKVFFRNM